MIFTTTFQIFSIIRIGFSRCRMFCSICKVRLDHSLIPLMWARGHIDHICNNSNNSRNSRNSNINNNSNNSSNSNSNNSSNNSSNNN